MKKTNTKKVAGIVGAVGAVALGAYLYSKTEKGKKQVTKLKSKASAWVDNAKKDVLKKVKDLKEVNKERYHEVVDTVLEKYQIAKKIAPKEIASVSKEIKKHWDKAKKDIEKKLVSDIKKEI